MAAGLPAFSRHEPAVAFGRVPREEPAGCPIGKHRSRAPSEKQKASARKIRSRLGERAPATRTRALDRPQWPFGAASDRDQSAAASVVGETSVVASRT